MPYRICKTLYFEGGHALSKHPEDCKFPHGHSRRVDIVLEGESLNASDMVCDFKLLSKAFKNLIATFDHALCMNSKDPMFKVLRKAYGNKIVPFEGKDPTSEVLAKLLFDQGSKIINDSRKRSCMPYVITEKVKLTRVRVYETASSWAEYEN